MFFLPEWFMAERTPPSCEIFIGANKKSHERALPRQGLRAFMALKFTTTVIAWFGASLPEVIVILSRFGQKSRKKSGAGTTAAPYFRPG
jgi:hypothetical protein